MGIELVNRVSIKKDGVYVSSHSSNDTSPFTSNKNNPLTEMYKSKGQKAVDRHLVYLALDGIIEFTGKHKSIAPYNKAIDKFYNDKSNEPLITGLNIKTNKIDDMFYKRQTLDNNGNIKLNDLILERKELKEKKLNIISDMVQDERNKLISQEMEVD